MPSLFPFTLAPPVRRLVEYLRMTRKRAARGVLVAMLVATALPLASVPANASAAQAVAQGIAPTLEDFKRTLDRFGRFVYSERYGDVWQPSVLPPGWHPYPACNWVYDRSFGWTYDDRTEWGRIVHHYGRWAHDAQAGWVWIPGAEWSPAWVIWRTGAEWTGWAPTPPASDQQETTLAAFETDKQWTFMETAKIGVRCRVEAAAPSPAPILKVTRIVNTVTVVKGIAITVLPPPPGITLIDFDTGPIGPWPSAFLGDWISLMSALSSGSPMSLASAALCAPAVLPLSIDPAFKSSPPPAPGKRAGPPVRKVVVVAPPATVVVDPPRRRVRPVAVTPGPEDLVPDDRPRRPRFVRPPRFVDEGWQGPPGRGPGRPPRVRGPRFPIDPGMGGGRVRGDRFQGGRFQGGRFQGPGPRFVNPRWRRPPGGPMGGPFDADFR